MIFSFFHIWLASVEFRREKSITWHVASNFLIIIIIIIIIIIKNMSSKLLLLLLFSAETIISITRYLLDKK